VTADFEPSPLQSLRRERIAACFQDSMPSAEEITCARARYLRWRARPRRLGTRALLVTLVQGMVLGLASAATAAFVADHVVRRDPPAAPVQTAPTMPAPTALARANRAAPRRAEPQSLEAAVPVTAPPRAAFEDLPPAVAEKAPSPLLVTEGPALGSAQRTRPPAAQRTPAPERARTESPRSGADDVAPVAAGVHSASLPAVPAPAGPWERVAKALEAGDWRGADSALNDLSGSGDAHARDAAALARAQLWITQGRGGEVRGTLQHLAQHGKTPLIRRRASALLQGL
jgi:hypothetical protein